MKRILLSALCIFMLGVSNSHAADGAECAISNWQITLGTVRTVWCIILCDAKTADGECADVDLNTLGQPDQIHFQLETETSCTAGTLDITSSKTATSTEYDIGSVNDLVVGSGNTKLIRVNTREAGLNRFVQATLTAEADCAPFTVHMIGYEVKR